MTATENPNATYAPPQHRAGPAITKQGAWAAYLLVGFTFGIYYFIWYRRINRELCAVLGIPVPFNGKARCTIFPILNIIGLAATAGRVNAAHERIGSPVRVNGFVACFLAPMWFGSQVRYLQRRVNALADALGSAS